MSPTPPTDRADVPARRLPTIRLDSPFRMKGPGEPPPGPVAGTVILAAGLITMFALLAIKIASS